MTELEQAIADMEEARDSHVKWAAHLGAQTDCERCDPSITGTKEENEEWVKRYDRVLGLLKTDVRNQPDFLGSLDSLLSWIAHRGWRVDLEDDRRAINDRFIPELRRLANRRGRGLSKEQSKSWTDY